MRKLSIVLIILSVVILAGTLLFFYLQNKKEPDFTFYYDPGEPFITDICGSRRLLKTDIILKLSDKRKEKYYQENNHRIRNEIIFVLRSKTEAELESSKGHNELVREILKRLNEAFETDEFLDVYFNEFVMQ